MSYRSGLRQIFAKMSEIDAERVSDGLADPRNSEWSLLSAREPRSKERNRYSNVLPWEKTRVKLPVVDSHSDYINASYIKIQDKVSYIACQGPLIKTTHHFWAMCYNESEVRGTDTILIVMVTPLVENGLVKCCKYWPDEETPSFDLTSLIAADGIDIPQLKINYKSSVAYDGNAFTLNTFELISGSKRKTVYHIQYHDWTDSDRPSSIEPLCTLSKLVKEVQDKEEKEIIPIVHCSAGVGRTGTFIIFDHIYNKRISISGEIEEPVLNLLFQLRECRMLMVQTFSQFKFLDEFSKKYLD